MSNFILDLLAFIERCITRDLNFGMMNEHIRPTFVRSDEAETFFRTEPFYCACIHTMYFLNLMSRLFRLF